jgi:hypothetical protein
MKRLGRVVWGLALVLAAATTWAEGDAAAPAATAPATQQAAATSAEEGIAVSVTSDVNSAYVWRGITFAKGGVWQPALDVSGIKVGQVKLGLNVWTNFNLSTWDGAVQKGQFSEVDFTLGAELPGGFKASYIEYVFAVGGNVDFVAAPEPSTRELMAGWSHDFAVTPTVCLYYDIEAIKSPFLLVSLARQQKLNDKASVTFQAEAGLAGTKFAEYYGGTKGGLYHYAVSARGSYQATEKVGLSALVGYSGGFDKDVLPDEIDLGGGASKKVGLYGPYVGVSLNIGL